jgi:hypothetical protein
MSKVTHAQKFSLGMKAGPLLTWANFGDKDDKDVFSHKVKPGFTAQGLINFPLKNDYSFQTEVGFSQRGRKFLFNDDTWENNATYYFIDIAMMLRKSFKFQLGKNIPANWFINIGPHISYWIDGKGEVSVNTGSSYPYTIVYSKMPESPPSPDFDSMYLTGINHWLFGLDFGIGFIAPIKSSQNLVTELRFTSGHTYYGSKTSASNRTLGFADNLMTNEKFLSITVAYTFDFDLRKMKMGRSNKDKEMHRKPTKNKKN